MFPSKVIGAEHLAKMKDAIAKVDDALHEARLGVRAGVIDQSKVDELQAAKDQIMKVKGVYFPNH